MRSVRRASGFVHTAKGGPIRGPALRKPLRRGSLYAARPGRTNRAACVARPRFAVVFVMARAPRQRPGPSRAPTLGRVQLAASTPWSAPRRSSGGARSFAVDESVVFYRLDGEDVLIQRVIRGQLRTSRHFLAECSTLIQRTLKRVSAETGRGARPYSMFISTPTKVAAVRLAYLTRVVARWDKSIIQFVLVPVR
jgi:hypothetical protein